MFTELWELPSTSNNKKITTRSAEQPLTRCPDMCESTGTTSTIFGRSEPGYSVITITSLKYAYLPGAGGTDMRRGGLLHL